MRRSLAPVSVVLLLGLLASTADAGAVLMIGPSSSGLLTDGALAQYGHTLTSGPTYDAFDGTLDLSAYDVIVLSAVDYARPDMPLAGQQAIVDFVSNGGGLITGEWTTWRTGMGGASFSLLYPLFPTNTDGSYIGGAGSLISVRYEQVTPDPVLNQGLPTSMDFDVNAAGSEIIVPKVGATVFYSGDSVSPNYVLTDTGWVEQNVVYPSAGLVGWDYGLGRVLTFSTTLQQPVGPDYTDDYSRLVANSISWAGAGASPAEVPEPTSIVLFSCGALALTCHRRRRPVSHAS